MPVVPRQFPKSRRSHRLIRVTGPAWVRGSDNLSRYFKRSFTVQKLVNRRRIMCRILRLDILVKYSLNSQSCQWPQCSLFPGF